MKYFKYCPFHLIYLLIRKAKNIFCPEKGVNKFFIAIAFIFFISGNSFAQQPASGKTVLDTLVTVSLDNQPLKECLSKLTDAYGVNFSYINDELPLQNQIHCRLVDQSLKTTLDTICKQADIRYFLVGTQIVLKKNENNLAPVPTDTSSVLPVRMASQEIKIDTVYQIARGKKDDTYPMNKKYRKYFSNVFGKQRAPDSMIVVYSNGIKDTITNEAGTKKHRYVNRTCLYTSMFSVGAFGGIGVAYRKLSGDDWVVSERNSDEHSIVNYVAGIQVTQRFARYSISLRSGLQYITFGEKGTFDEIILIPPSQSQPGPPTEKIITHSYQNRMNYLMLPVMAGYKFNLHTPMRVSVYSGLSFAFLLNTSSTYKQPLYTGSSQNSSGWFNHNSFLHDYNHVSLVLPVQVEIAYPVRTNLHLFAMPMFNYFLTSIYSKDEMSSSRPYAFDFVIGFNYFF